MKRIDKLTVTYRGRTVGTLTMTPDSRRCAFAYDKEWLRTGFSIAPLELPLKGDLFIAKPEPFDGNFGIFKDSLPDNKDDHAKNFAFLCEDNHWNLAPAYDLTRCTAGYNGEHATTVNGKGNPTEEDMLAVGETIRIPRKRGQEIIRSVAEACREILAEEWKSIYR